MTCMDEAREEESYFSLAMRGSFTEKGCESWAWKEVRPSRSAGGRGESQGRETRQHAEGRAQGHVTGGGTSGLFPSLGHVPDIALIFLPGESTFLFTLYCCSLLCSLVVGPWCQVPPCPKQVPREH